MQQGIGGRQSELANHPGSQPPHAVPDPARVEDYVRRCLTVEFTEQPEARTYRSDPALASVLTPLNSQQFSAAVAAGRARRAGDDLVVAVLVHLHVHVVECRG